MKKILIIGPTKGGGIATANNMILSVFKDEDILGVKVVDKSKTDFLRVPILKYLYYYLLSIIALIRFKPDIVYLQVAESTFKYQTFILKLSRLFLGKKTINIAHLHSKPNLKKIGKRKLIKSQGFIDKIFVISKQCIEILKGYEWSTKIYYLPNFIDRSMLKQDIITIEKRKYILYIGRMHKTKGIFQILDIAKELPEEDFLFIGNFVNKDKNVELQFISLIDKITNAKWIGPIYNSTKYSYISESKLLLFPTSWPGEIFPLTLIECGLYKVPVFITPIGAIPEIINDGINGVFIDHNNINNSKNKLLQYLNDATKLRYISENIYKDCINKYTKDAVKTMLVNSTLN